MSPINNFIAATQFWLIGLIYSTASYLFKSQDADVQLESCLTATSFTYSLIWMTIWFREGKIFEYVVCLGAVFTSFILIVHFLSRSYGLHINIGFIFFTMIATFATLMAYLHLSIDGVYFIGQCTTAALVLAPTCAYRHISVPPLQFYVCSLGFAAFWVIIVILEVERRIWPLPMAILTFIGTVRQFIAYQGSVMIRRRNNRPDQTFVPRELHLSLDRSSLTTSDKQHQLSRSRFTSISASEETSADDGSDAPTSPTRMMNNMFEAPFQISPYTIANQDDDEEVDDNMQNSISFHGYGAIQQQDHQSTETADEMTRILPATFSTHV